MGMAMGAVVGIVVSAGTAVTMEERTVLVHSKRMTVRGTNDVTS
jgi:hypothetical protein